MQHLLSPIDLPRITLRNRIVMTAHRKALDLPSLPGPNEAEYLARRARGGAGLLLTEASAVHPTAFPYAFMPTPYERGKIPAYEQVAEAVHAHGAAIFGQVYHCGAEMANGFHSDLPVWGPSNVRGWGSQEICHEMTVGEIEAVIEGFAQASINLQEAGFDGVEIHAANGYMVQQFLSPMTNRRDDDYGGSLENRMRFCMEVIAAVREATGPEFPIGVKLCLEERVAGGIEVTDGLKIAAAIEATGEVDYICATNGTHESRELYVPSGGVPEALPAMTYGQAAKEVLDLPVMALGAVRSGEAAEQLIRSGSADLVGMLRALIADPDLPNRIAEGREGEGRPCIGINYCFRRATTEAALRCAVNPAAGRELAVDKVLEKPLTPGFKVAVIGAGPAGLEAACTAAERGAEVTLFDAQEDVGGLARQAAAFPGKQTSSSLLEYFRGRLARSTVQLELGTRIDDLGTLDSGFDSVIVATGSKLQATPWHDRAADFAARWNGPDIFDAEWTELLKEDHKGKRVVLVEGEPVDYIAVTLAGFFAQQEVDLRIVTSYPNFAMAVDGPATERIHGQLADRRVPVYATSHLLPSSSGDSVHIWHAGLKQEQIVEDVDLIVTTAGRKSRIPKEGGWEGKVLYAGDCVAPRGIPQAIREGNDAALAI